MELSKNYDHLAKDEQHYSQWQKHGLFHSEPDDREPYTIVIPPPNVTGVLHMGHMLNNTIQDVLVRRARLLGKNACWVPGTDHASIATEAKVVKRLEERGIKKEDLSRAEFLEHAWEWTEEYGGTILNQLKRLGASCDWERTRFTLEEDLSAAVIDVFVDLYNKGYIYKGVRMVNWDPKAQTALSDEEVIHKEVNSKLYYIKYDLVGSEEKITIATTRPETILGDTAICINPRDERWKHLKNKKAIVPMVNREIPIIEDDYVDLEFGTGCLKVTPAHDINDYELGLKHNLPSIDILNDDGTLSAEASYFVGDDRFVAREKIAKELEKQGRLLKVEELINKVGFSERTDAVIEPKLSLQWFMKMEELAQPASENVMNGDINFYPENTKNTYKHWMENIKDWCISRQLWWGHRIPAYYYGEGPTDFAIANTPEKALEIARTISGNKALELNDLKQDEDVLDTWFSSWLWPISVFDGFKNPDNPDINYYYPTNDLVTAPEIMFFWVARMVMAGYEYQEEKPFKNVYYTGIVRDKLRRKMSKSLGNSPDPIKLIEKYSADGVRVGMLLSSPAGNDLLFDESLCEQGSKFSNKLWNAFRLIKSWNVSKDKVEENPAKIGNEWLNEVFQKALSDINMNFDKFRISDALMTVYKLTWEDFCSWYLEMVKPSFGESIAQETYNQVLNHLENLLRVINPFMPFITEEIFQNMSTRDEGEFLMVNKWPESKSLTGDITIEFETAKNVIAEIRSIRKDKNIPFKEALELKVIESDNINSRFFTVIEKLTNLSAITFVKEKVDGSLSFVVNKTEFYVPLKGAINLDDERSKLEDEITYLEGFLVTVGKKLSNERFVNNAPEKVVAMEQKKHSDAKEKIVLLQKQLANL